MLASLLGNAFDNIVPFVLIMSALIFVHEFGHYIVARWNGVRVDVFSIGFGPEITGWNDRHGTRWKLSWVPLGGYVKFFGDANAASAASSDVDTMSAEERAVSFHHKRLSQRAAIVAAGPIANFLTAILIFAVVFSIIGQPFTKPVLTDVVAGSAAEEAGLRPGDRVVRVNGAGVERFEDLQRIVQMRPNENLRLDVERDGGMRSINATPRLYEMKDNFGNVHRIGQLGIRSTSVEYVRHDPVSAVWYGTKATWDVVTTTLVAVKQMIVGARSTSELSGVIGIAQMSGQVAKVGFMALVQFAAFLSVSLGLINLFPIPVLDGGHLLYYVAEALRGRPLSERVQEYGLRFGLLLVVGLLFLTTFNDLNYRLNVFGFVSSLFS